MTQALRDAIAALALERPGLDEWPGGESLGTRRGTVRYYEFDSSSVPEYSLVMDFFSARGLTIVCSSESRTDL